MLTKRLATANRLRIIICVATFLARAGGAQIDPAKFSSHPVLSHCEIGWRMYEVPKIGGIGLGPRPLGTEGAAGPQKHAVTRVTCPNSVALGQIFAAKVGLIVKFTNAHARYTI